MIAARPVDVNLRPRVVPVARFEQLFRRAAATEVDKTDLRRHSDFVNRKLHDLSVVGVPYVKALEVQLTVIVGGLSVLSFKLLTQK